ncbi:MAG TPA: hypothetical protein VK646_13460 [Actinomycetota bacterium]|nr:hypothetical protein [Actinomycetota bacterium]
MRRIAVLLVLCLAALVVPARAATTSTKVGFDPDDRPRLGSDPDLRSTWRTVRRGPHGHGWLTVAFRAYEPLGVFWFVNVFLDTRGGPRWDYRMNLIDADLSGRGCWLRSRLDRSLNQRSRFRMGGDHASCTVPIGSIVRTKPIRWRLVSPSGSNGIADVAPNGGGWYPGG